MKSKDIDIIVDYDVLSRIRQVYDLIKNDRLKKYEIHLEDVDIEIYVPFYSNPGMPAEVVVENKLEREGFSLPRPEHLLLMKQFAYSQRRGTPKGEKDTADVVRLLVAGINWAQYLIGARRHSPNLPSSSDNSSRASTMSRPLP